MNIKSLLVLFFFKGKTLLILTLFLNYKPIGPRAIIGLYLLFCLFFTILIRTLSVHSWSYYNKMPQTLYSQAE